MSRNKVLEAAVELFAEKGYHQASMDDIALRANVAKGTLYYHFTGKSQLFRTIVSDGLQRIKVRIEADLNAGLALEEQIKRVIGHNLDLFTESSGLAHIVFHELTNGIEEEVLAELKRMREEYVRFIAGILEEGQKLGIVRLMNSTLAAAGLLGLLDSCCDYFLSNNRQISRDVIENFIYTTVTSGLFIGREQG
ncbi:TetR/AcrR family transcriptional regulator [Paenibacillus mesophilus]|uniref:TetR/AcrR family transcriptional regulator n=1 Tax=Paenibacillus mesophilus TaxID=2582849 RepID=UPI00110E84E7|nr:TetR/AcrR family transcriptional regulator [Paenibacillus mesophilus]TMV52752.1 TetR/AcrR family transcriptional regulator [Paenibacillus mesophilus]